MLNKSRWVSVLCAAVWLAGLMVLVSPICKTPEEGLDPSWAWAMNHLIHLPINFDDRIIFTFGPLGYLYTPYFSPELYGQKLIFRVLMYGLISALTWLTLVRSGRSLVVATGLALAIQLLPNLYQYDTAVPILAALYILTVFQQNALSSIVNGQKLDVSQRFVRRSSQALLNISAAFFAVLVMVKGTFLIICGIVIFVDLWQNWTNGKKLPFNFFIFLSVFFALWFLRDQDFAALIPYFINQLELISNYSEAMSSGGIAQWDDCLWFILYCVFLHLTWARTAHLMPKSKSGRWFFQLSFAALHFLVFKASFVRHDAHAIIGFNYIAFVVLLTVLLRRPHFANSVAKYLYVLMVLWAVNLTYNGQVKHIGHPAYEHWRQHWQNLRGWTEPTETYKRLVIEYDMAVAQIRQSSQFQNVQGSVDLYPFSTALLLANEFQWKPRPTIQSYVAYSQRLLKLNADFLAHQGTDNIFFRIDTIDNRLPMLDDSLSWLELAKHYQYQSTEGQYLLFKRKVDATAGANFSPIANVPKFIRFNEPLVFPSRQSAIWLKLHIEKSWIGKIVKTLFKLPELIVEIDIEEKGLKTFRIIPGMSSAGFMISPFIDTKEGFLSLLQREVTSQPKVRSIVVKTKGIQSWFYKDVIPVSVESLTWSEVK